VRDDDFNLAEIASHVDGLVLMNYDEHFPEPARGPSHRRDWFTENLAAAVKTVPKDKIICAIANYGYDWTQNVKRAGWQRGGESLGAGGVVGGERFGGGY